MNEEISKKWEKVNNEGFYYAVYNPSVKMYAIYAPSVGEYAWLGDEATATKFITINDAERWIEKHSAFKDGGIIVRIDVRSVFVVSQI